MPIGMECGVDVVLFGYNTGSGVKSKNPFKNPIKIIIWTEFDGPIMVIFCKIIELVPNSGKSSLNSSNSSINSSNT